MSIQSSSQTAGAGAAITLVATLISVYIVSQFLRNSIGVIAPNLAKELALSPGEIGLLSSVFFLVFAAFQIPVGVSLMGCTGGRGQLAYTSSTALQNTS